MYTYIYTYILYAYIYICVYMYMMRSQRDSLSCSLAAVEDVSICHKNMICFCISVWRAISIFACLCFCVYDVLCCHLCGDTSCLIAICLSVCFCVFPGVHRWSAKQKSKIARKKKTSSMLSTNASLFLRLVRNKPLCRRNRLARRKIGLVCR